MSAALRPLPLRTLWHSARLPLALVLFACLPCSAGRYTEILARGPCPYLKGVVLRQKVGNVTAGAFAEPAAAEWSGEGTEELIVGSGYGDLLYFRRRPDGLLGEPEQMLPEPLSFLPTPPQPSPISPSLTDWDGEGRVGLIVGMRDRVYWCRRTETGLAPAVELPVSTSTVAGLVRALDPNCGHLAPCAADLTGTGRLDLLVGDDQGQVWWLENQGTRTAPSLAPPRRLLAGGQVVNVGSRARLAVGDWNGDGYPDLFIGSGGGTVYLCLGGPQGLAAPQPLYGSGAPCVPPDTDSPRDLSPAFTFWLGRGKGPRLLVGDRRGFVALLAPTNGGGARLEGYLQAQDAPVDVGRCASPCVVDWSGSRQLDLVVGGEDGYLQLFQRVSNDPPLFAAGQRIVDTKGPVRADARPGFSPHLRYAWPCVTDMDRDGQLDLLLGQASGRVRLWLNHGGLVPVGEVALAGQVLTLAGATTVNAYDYRQNGSVDLFVGTRLLPGQSAQGHLSPEQVIYLENSATKPGQAPLFIKAVRIDAFVTPGREAATPWDADFLGLSSLQPVHWGPGAALEYLAGTRLGALVFHSDVSRRDYPRLELKSPGSGLPPPLLPPAWRYCAARLTGGEQGIVCGTEEFGWVVWYPKESLPARGEGM